MSISAVVLAAGGSQRMGRAKQLLPVDGQPMLAHLVDTVLASGLEEVIVVLGAAASEAGAAIAGKRVQVIVNPGWAEGMASSLRTGLGLVSPRAEAVLFVPADLPQLQASTIQAIVVHFLATRRPIIIPTYRGQRGNPVLFARSLFLELLALSGDSGGRSLFGRHHEDIALLEAGDSGILLDVDTPEDYAALLIR